MATTSKLCFVSCVNTNRPLVELLVRNLRQAAPGHDVVLYNGGGPEFDLSGIGVDVNPRSRKMRYSYLTGMLADTARWLVETSRVPDYLVLVEPDMMLIKPGLAEHLDRIMGDASYLGANFHKVRPGWADNPIGRRARWKWDEGWRDLTGSPAPYHSFNPGQIFGREYVEKLAALPHLDRIVARAEASRLEVLEEILYPTLAVSMGCRALSNPGSHALTLRWYAPTELQEFLEDDSVYLVHRVSGDPGAGDRRMIQDSLDGRLRPVAEYDDAHVPSDLRRRTKILAERFVRRRKLDLIAKFRSEVPRSFSTKGGW
ncbi:MULTISPECIES: hypothetical protein [Actinosynnema]|uniref:hypothetical protein n=1 Tax=Actinosynnema TaxID=40566 RepID=UPI0020A27F26|nr:hypothetical protein [Actinosynnema pretiosum]MCP2097753.1 hypothetical protein [Actinosynnema pretiosum]